LLDEYACSKLDKLETTTAAVRDVVTGVEQTVAPIVNAGIAVVDAAVDSLLPAADTDAADAADADEADEADEASAPLAKAEPAEPAPYVVGAETAKAVARVRAVTSKAQARVYARALENIRNAHLRSEGAVAALRPYTIDLIAFDAGGAAAFPATQQLLAAAKETSASVLDATQLEKRARGALAAASEATHRAFAAINVAQAAVVDCVSSAKARANASVARARAAVDGALAVIGESKASLVARSSATSREQVTAQVAAVLDQLRLKANDLRLQLQSLTKDDVVSAAVAVRDDVYEYLMQRRALALGTALADAPEGAPAAAEPAEPAEPAELADTAAAQVTEIAAAAAQATTTEPATEPQPVIIKRKISFTMGSAESDAELERESNEAAEKLYA